MGKKGKFDDLKDLLEMLERMDEDEDITVEVIHSREDLDKRLKELDEEGYSFVGKDAKPKKEEKPKEKVEETDEALEKERKKALDAKKALIDKVGKDRTAKLIDSAAASAAIQACLDLDIPIRQDMFEEYNTAVKGAFPERCDLFALSLAYGMIDRMKVEGVKSLE